MKIRHVHLVRVGDTDATDAGSREIHRSGRAETAGAYDEDGSTLEFLLSVDPEARQAYLTRIAPELVGLERSERPRLVAGGGGRAVSGQTVRARPEFHVLTREIEAPKYTRPSESRTGVPLSEVWSLVKRLFVFVRGNRDRKLTVERRVVEPLDQPRRWRDDQRGPLPLDQSFASQTAKHERHGFASCAYELAQQPVARSTQHNATVLSSERVVVRHTQESRNEALFHAQRGQLPKFVQKRRSFGHQLVHERQGT